jgi:transmembrane sensor
VVGVACACGVLTTLMVARRPQSPASAARTQPTATVILPERRTLEDGSRVELRAGAQIRAECTPAERRVALLEGEAHFEVSKDAARPFVVDVRGVQVRAVGTAFVVGLDNHTVDVLVTEGVVAVERIAAHSPVSSTHASGGERLSAGQHAVVELAAAAPPALRSLSPGEAAQRLAWRVPRLEFSATPLTEVVTLFRLHGGIHLQLADAALGNVRVSGVLRANNTAALLRLLAADHDIVAESRGDDIVLRRR